MGDVPQEARVPTALPAIQVRGTAGNLLQIIGMYQIPQSLEIDAGF